jgi:hypothetical protein
MLVHIVNLITKIDPLKYLLRKATITGRLAKWVMISSEFDIHYIDQRAIKGQVIVDQLVEAPLQESNPMHIDFLDVDVFTKITKQSWELYFDGSYT